MKMRAEMVLSFEILNWQKYNPRTDAKVVSWVRLDCAITRSSLWHHHDARVLRVWLWCLMAAASSRGARVVPIASVSRECGMAASSVLRCMDFLQDSEIIRYETKLLSNTRALRNGTERYGTVRNEKGRINARAARESDTPTLEPKPDESKPAEAEVHPHLVAVLASPTEDDDPEAKTESDKPRPLTRDEQKAKWPRAARLAHLWNFHGENLPEVKSISKSRDEKAKLRLAEHPDDEFWIKAITNLSASSFARQWATIDWLLANDTNALKAFEGAYRDKVNG